MRGEYSNAHESLLSRGEVHQPNDTAVRLAAHDYELSEVLIQRDEDPLLTLRSSQDLIIAWIVGPSSRPNDIVTCGFDLLAGATPDAGVE